MGKTQVCARSSQARGDPFRHPRDAIDDCVHWLAPFGDSALGGPLSLLCFRSWESAFYFSAARYATVGYGDVVLPWTWRTLGPVESIIGVLMCGPQTLPSQSRETLLLERGFAAAEPRDAAGRPYPSVRMVLARRLSVAGHGLVAPRRKSPEGNLTMASTEKLDTHHKALTLNLDASAFGSFAEIGAGQEVARWFLVVGGASGTVAKTISAYDKEVSDDLYGSGSRYVSRQRLEAMLDHEWSQLLTQLSKT